MTMSRESFFKIETVDELKVAMQDGESIHQCDREGYNLYYYAPIEMYPFLKENNVEVNVTNGWGDTYLEKINDTEKLRFLIKNGLDKTKYRSSPYGNADFYKTRFLLEENVPYKIEDFSESFIIQQYLFEINILSEKPPEVTGVNLIRMSNMDFFIFSKNYKESLIKIIKESNLIKNLSYNKLISLRDNGYDLSEFEYSLDKLHELKDCSLDEIKELHKAGFNFKIKDKKIEGLLKFKNEKVIDYLLAINDIKDNFFDKDAAHEILSYAKEYILLKQKRQQENVEKYGAVVNFQTIEDYKYEYTVNLDYLSNKKTIMNNFDLPFKDEVLLSYLMKYNKNFLSILIAEKVKTKEDYKILLENKYITNSFKKEALLNLSSDKFSQVVRSNIFTDIDLELSIEDVFKLIDKKYKIDWLAKDKDKTSLLEKIMNKMSRSSVYKEEDCWPKNNKEYEMILEKIMPDIIKNNNSHDINKFASKLCYLQDIVYLSDNFNIHMHSANILDMIDSKKIRRVSKLMMSVRKDCDEKIEELKMKEYLLKINNEGYKINFKYQDFQLESNDKNVFNFNIDIYIEDALELINKKVKINWLTKGERDEFFIDEIINRGSSNPVRRIDRNFGSYYSNNLLTKAIEQLKENNPEDVQFYLMSVKYIDDVLEIFENCNIYPFYDSVDELYSKNKRLPPSRTFTTALDTPIEKRDSFIKLKSLIEKRVLEKKIDKSVVESVTKKKRI